MNPEVLLMDEPTASLDAKAGGEIEGLILSLKSRCAVLMVSHYMDQVSRIADQVMTIQSCKLTPA